MKTKLIYSIKYYPRVDLPHGTYIRVEAEQLEGETTEYGIGDDYTILKAVSRIEGEIKIQFPTSELKELGGVILAFDP